MNIIIDIFTKIITTDRISKVIARLIGKLLNNASKKRGKTWTSTKKIVSKIRVWLDLFDQVYEDDEMTQEEEEIISKAIQNEVDIDSVVKILKKASQDSK